MINQKSAAGFSMTTAAPAAPRLPGGGSEVLGRQACLQLLARAGVGRVAVSVGALPTVLPVCFNLVGDDVVFAAFPGSDLELAVRGAVVAFETDHVDPGGGWSVVVTGVATEVHDERVLQLLRAISVVAGAGHEAQSVFRVPTDMISGRHLPRAPLHVAGTVPTEPVERRARNGSAPGAIPPPLDPAPYEEIPPEECLRLLATEEVGRLVAVLAGQPLVFPLNYALDGDAVVFRTAPGTKLEAISRSLVAFEVDRWAPTCQSGWSVVVEGIAQEVTSADAPGLRERLAALPVRPLANGDRLHFVRIVPISITGSRLRPATDTRR